MNKAAQKRAEIYSSRNEILRRLGFANYQSYLASELWLSIRERVLAEMPPCRANCGRVATQVHHGKYRLCDLVGLSIDHLYPICGSCHFSIEFDKDGTKLDTTKATRNLHAKAYRNERPYRRHERRKGKKRRVVKQPSDDKAAAETLADYDRRRKLWVHPRKRR